jgi:triacylglycerol lipase
MNLVFASGFLVPQSIPGTAYFRGLEAHLAGRHATLFPGVPPLGSSEQRARLLADAIHGKFPRDPVHIIAHSMGGLDARVLIARNHHGLSEPGRIASLTTLSTPHLGSPIADLVVDTPPVSLDPVTYQLIRQLINGLGLASGAIGDLTTAGASQIPNVAATHPHIRYRSYAAIGRHSVPATSPIFVLTHGYICSEFDEENDGLVTLKSAQYGEFQQPAWAGDHADIVGHNLDFPPLGRSKFDHLAAIDAIIEQL